MPIIASPLRIASPVGFPNIGMSLCPGKIDPWAMTGPVARDLFEDLTIIKNWGASLIISLLEDFELETLKVKNLGDAAVNFGMEWRHWPTIDGSPLSVRKNQKPSQWDTQIQEFIHRLDKGEKIFIHCRGGLGRTGTLAARILIEKGIEPDEAIDIVRRARPGAIETNEQEQYLLQKEWQR